jgi:hypothetical protein
MAKINVKLTHREKPCAVQLDKYGMVSLKNGVAVIAVEKNDLKALQKQGNRDTKFIVEEVIPTKATEPPQETAEEVKSENVGDPADVTKGGK